MGRKPRNAEASRFDSELTVGSMPEFTDLRNNIGIPVDGDGGAEADIIAGGPGIFVIAAEVLEVFLVVGQDLKGMVLGDGELAGLELLQEIRRADLLRRAVGSLEEEGSRDENERRGQENDAPPVEVWIAAVSGIAHARVLGRPLV